MSNTEYTCAPNEINRLSECYIAFRLGNWFITDNKILITVPDPGFCHSCFKRRYFSEYDGTRVGDISESALDLARTIDKSCAESRPWTIYSIDRKEKVKSFRLASYDNCSLCKKDASCSRESASIRYGKLLNKMAAPEPGAVKELLFSFGFARAIATRDRLGFNDERFEKLLGGNFYSQVTARMLDFNGQPAEFTTLGYARNRGLAETKSVMEYVERYAFLEQTNLLQTGECDENIIEGYLSRYSRDVTGDEMEHIRSEAIWAVNLVSGDVAPVPLRFIYDKGDLGFIRPSSSGFAAHVDFRHSLAGSILELVERDAFVRFWHDPLKAYNFFPEEDIQKDINTVCSVLGWVLGNEALVSKCYVVQSPSRIPVVMTTISSPDASKAPSLVFGYGAGFNIRQALSGSLNELRTNSINLIVSAVNDREYLTRKFSPATVTGIPERMNYYSTKDPRPRLVFLDTENPLKDDIYEEIDGGDLDKVVKRFEGQGLGIFGIDVTPVCFRERNAVVTRAFSPDLYPLQYKEERSLNIMPRNSSVRDELPHFFI